MVEHTKQRAGNAGYERHWHLLVPEVNVVTGRVLDAHYMRVRHERIARLAEYEFGHSLVRGAHNRAVCQWLEEHGRPDVVADMGWSKAKLAREAGLSVNALSAMDAPDWNPTIETIRKIEALVPPNFNGVPSRARRG